MMERKFIIPIYDANLVIVVARDIYSERQKFDEIFGPIGGDDFSALCSYTATGEFGLFFTPKYFDHNRIAHEVFHLTHRILDWANVNFDRNNHEAAALLCGYLTELVYGVYKKGGRS
jgi:hypothetical protein